jgi:3-hydroxyisobutyrate dehydrogenase-like beta-hydroxyacid dehydrogenase
MSQNLIKKGYDLTVCDLIAKRVEPLKKMGAKIADTPKAVAEKSDVVITIVLSSPDVRAAILGENGVIEGIREGATVIDMSTIDPVTTREVSQKLSGKGVKMLDAPVARGVKAAVAGTLAIFVGGEKEVYDQCKEILAAMGSDVEYVGDIGAGEIVKIINNLIIAVSMCSLSEALVLGVKAGVKPDVLIEALSKGSAGSFVLQNHVKKFVLQGKFDKEVFPVDYIMKDLDLAKHTAANYHVPQYFGAMAYQAYEWARAAGYRERYYPVVIKVLEALAGVEVRADREDE